MDAERPDPSSPPKTGPELAELLATDHAQRTTLVKYAHSRFGISGPVCEDLLQETIVELMLVRATTTIQSPAGFVFRIFHIRCCRYSMRPERREITSGLTPSTPDPSPFQDRRALLLETLHEGFTTLSLVCRQILTARYVEGRSLRETAEAVSRAYSGIPKLISRCLKHLRMSLSA